MGIRAASRGAGGRLDGRLGRSVYRATVPAGQGSALRARLESAVRAGYEADGFEVRTEEFLDTWFLLAHRGFTAGFGVGLFAQPGTAGVLVGVGRSSRLDESAGWVAGGLAALAAALSVLAIGAAGWALPGAAVAGVALGVAVAALLIAYQLLIPAVAAAEFLGGGRFDAARIAAVVDLVRREIEAGRAPTIRQPTAEPGAAPDPAGM